MVLTAANSSAGSAFGCLGFGENESYDIMFHSSIGWEMKSQLG